MDEDVSLDGYFKQHYKLEGRDWLCKLPEEEQEAFAYYGRMKAQHGRLGGKARSQQAKRDRRGRFTGGSR